MPTVVDIANYTLTVYGPAENPYQRSLFTAAERASLAAELASRGFTMHPGYTEVTVDGTFFRATRNSDGVVIQIKVERK